MRVGPAAADLPWEAATVAANLRYVYGKPPTDWFYCPWSLAPKVRKPSAGIVALEPGASLLIVLNAYMARDGSLEEGRAASEGAGAPVTLKLTHLVSYEGMGVARGEILKKVQHF